jgi:predicted Zn finger-like uncharacterized protein
MPVIIACPSCGGKLRVADSLRGQMVRCPACDHTFDSSTANGYSSPLAPQPSALDPQDLPLQLAIDDPNSTSQPPSDHKRGLVGAIELNPTLEADSPAPPPPSETEPRPLPPRRKPRLTVDFEDETDLPFRQPRRDAEPDRGTTVLVLGILSLASMMISCVPVGVILGLIAWTMGQTDLRKMKRGQMDDYGRSMTQAGWICGIVGTIVNSLAILGCMTLLGIGFFDSMNRPPLTTRITRPAQPKVPQPMPPVPPKK